MRYPWWAVLVVVTVFLGGCDDTLSVDDEGVLNPADLGGASGLPLIHDGAMLDFQRAFNAGEVGEDAGSGGGVVVIGGLLADEALYGATDPFIQLIDQRTASLGFEVFLVSNVYRGVQRARRSAERASDLFASFPDSATTVRRAQLLNLAGYTYIFMGENFCSGIPFSHLGDDGRPVYGEPRSTAEIFQLAVERFAVAREIATAAGGDGADAQISLADIGTGRALLNLGDFAGAAAAVAVVPLEFSYLVEFSENTLAETNAVFAVNNRDRGVTVPDVEGGTGLPYRSANDARVPVVQDDVTQNGALPLFAQQKYPSGAAPTELAGGTEAALIRAEAQLQSGAIPEWLAGLNDLRAGVGLAPLADPGTPEGRVDLQFQERGFWLWFTGHRLGDMRRLARPTPAGYGRAVESVFPSGLYVNGGQYGTNVSLPPSVDEVNNPHFQGCDTSVP